MTFVYRLANWYNSSWQKTLHFPDDDAECTIENMVWQTLLLSLVLGAAAVFATNSGACRPVQRFFFIKTHKTGSTTLSAILLRVLLSRGHSPLLVEGSGQELGYPRPIARASVFTDTPGPITACVHHTVFTQETRDTVQHIIGDHTTFTILRHPLRRFESAYNFFHVHRNLCPHNLTLSARLDKTSLETFLDNFDMCTAHMSNNTLRQVRTSALVDLGLIQADQRTLPEPHVFRSQVDALNASLDFVLMTDYWDLSMALLANNMCWPKEELLWYSQRVTHGSGSVAEQVMRDRILLHKFESRFWHEFILYRHFEARFFHDVTAGATELQGAAAKLRAHAQRARRLCAKSKEEWCARLKASPLSLRKITVPNRP